MGKYLLCLGGATGLLLLVNVQGRTAEAGNIASDVTVASPETAGKKWNDALPGAANLARKYDTEQVIHLMSKRNARDPKKGGIGVGPNPGVINPDGIEAKLISMSRVPLTNGELANAADFKVMGEQIATIGAIVGNHTPPKKAEDKGGAIWKDSAADMFAKSKDFVKAIDSKDRDAIRRAAKALDGTCKSCHVVYRP